jgi:acetyltransferase-like isoleucine patch superfamily enzyme
MEGATILGPAKLASLSVGSRFIIVDTRFGGQVRLKRGRVKGDLELEGSRFSKPVGLWESEIDGDLFASSSMFEQPVSLRGVIIRGSLFLMKAKFKHDFSMVGGNIASGVFVSESEFDRELDMRRSIVGTNVSIQDQAILHGNVVFDDAVISGDAYFTDQTLLEKELSMRNARIGGTLEITHCELKDKVWLEYSTIEDSVVLGANSRFFDELSMGHAFVGKDVSMENATFDSDVFFENMHVRNLALGPEATFVGHVSVSESRVDEELSMSKSSFGGVLTISGTHVGNLLVIGDHARFEIGLSLDNSKVLGSVWILGSHLGTVSITGARIDGTLDLEERTFGPSEWKEGASVDLRNTRLGTLKVPLDWKTEVSLDGLVYDHLGGTGVEDDPMLSRGAAWYIGFLALQESYSPQPYKQLADKLEENGQHQKAVEILYAGRERERGERNLFGWLGLSILKVVIGYGYGYYIFRVVYWIAVFIGIGTVVVWVKGAGRTEDRGLVWSVFFSIDRLLPIITLDKNHDDVELTGFALYYFYLHVVAGWVLALFLVAGISGLTKD